MRQAERLIALRELLARVQANASERRAELAAMGLGPDAPRPEPVAPPEPPLPLPPRVPTRERMPTPRGRFDDDWSSLLTRDLNDPSPERPPAPHQPPAPPALPFSRVASFAPPPLIGFDVTPLGPPASTTVPAARAEEDEKHPDSEIVRAIRLAAEQPHGLVDHRDLWVGAASELRERRGTNPPVPPHAEDLEADDDEPVLDLVRPTPTPSPVSSRPPPPPIEVPTPAEIRPFVAAPPIFAPPVLAPPLPLPPPAAGGAHRVPTPPSVRAPVVVGPAFGHERDQAAEAPPPRTFYEVPGAPSETALGRGRPRGRRLERPLSPRKRASSRVLAALVVAAPLAGLATWSLLDEPRRSVREAGASAVPTIREAPSTPRSSRRGPDPVPATALPPPPTPPTTFAPPAPLVAAPPTAIPPPPKVGNPRESGMLWVDADPASAIYVQGVSAGDSGRWLEVACGMKNVRLARPGPPPPGHSFPMWLGVGQTVLIPCGGSHRVALRPD